MLTNPLWRQPLAAFKETLRDWVYGSDPEGPMHLAIFLDSRAVAGDASAARRRRATTSTASSTAATSSSRASPVRSICSTSQPSWWHRLMARRDDEPLDLKKLGTFPIVHGVRALALQHRLRVNGTAARLHLLVEAAAARRRARRATCSTRCTT